MKNMVVDDNNLPGIIDELMLLGKSEVECGFFDDDVEYVKVADREEGEQSDISTLELARILHEGVNIEITPKMRNWLHFNGLHVKASTKYIKIPPRPFIEGAMDSAEKLVFATLERAISLITTTDGQKPVARAAWHRVGLLVTTAIKQSMVDLSEPRNHPFTISRKKGSSNPLIDRGRLKDAATYEVRESGSGSVGVA